MAKTKTRSRRKRRAATGGRRASPAAAAAGRHPRHRPHPRARRALLRHVARRHGRRGHQDRGARQGRRHARLAALRGRRGHLLPLGEPQQEEPHAEPEGARGAGDPARAHREGRRGAGELPARHDGAARLRLRHAAEGQSRASSTARSRASARAAPSRTGPATTSSCRASRGSWTSPASPTARPSRSATRSPISSRAWRRRRASRWRCWRASAPGKGQKVEIGMLDVMASLLTYQAGLYWNGGGRPARRGNEHPSIVPYEVFQAQDAYLTLGVANNSLWERACRAHRPRGSHQGPALRHRGQPRDQPGRCSSRSSTRSLGARPAGRVARAARGGAACPRGASRRWPRCARASISRRAAWWSRCRIPRPAPSP